ncbi:outer membrane lipoprotein carrier protein LolA [Verminephrobacter aporrectodeae subsp. tuberculatae]|uniref:Outer membrane lipoprotein carrier protein LolA n=1 Tax=Verminephrobacter aporrectodeae subsp. tuberculatae TaxID=1110392 RepID=A0ABT3KRP5_9BURK|nr:outer membrane lipoprotein carrier protein LolA [Verminephrobacter aporrectodeae]MCW5220048.1 outer membrane lipoprotein carrier protein LolA [Verminephrobacter aporrectodeae subsp. tuberculatae]MCW5289336.1 outer membrane lipoprotein carrier protein LolA [Verminephrobacter aporrectodeae subsp. tuberculatae]MCW5320999.1 outer membrane lipoprotein carrier protein LolA [Verminephrobacter aporrectodeae subsp. tuberculatae]
MKRRDVLRAGLAAFSGGLASAGGPARAQAVPDELAEIDRRLENPAVLRGEFEQTKSIQGFKRPLVSRGSFVMARGRGVQWITAQPFASTLVVTRERLLTLGEAGVSQQIDARQEPGLRALNEMLMALLAGDVQALAARFTAQVTLQGAHGWRLALTPRDAALAGFISRIELEGARHVNAVRLHETSGDASHIRFLNPAASALSPAEAERFGP